MFKKGFAAALTALLLSGGAGASSGEYDVYGTISDVDLAQRRVMLKSDDGKEYLFAVNPATDIEIKRKYWFDTRGELKDLKRGDWVKIEYKTMSPTYLVAEDIEVHESERK